jgi:tetratricopeptide (TPR) repeat protein
VSLLVQSALDTKWRLTPSAPGYRRRVTARTRIIGLVALASAAAVAVVAVAVVSAGDGSGEAATEAKPRPGRPPLSLALGFREDAEARDLGRAAELYARGELHAAGALFARHDSLEAKVGLALTGWPEGYDRIEQLAKLYPESAVVQLHLGLARLWAGRGDPVAAWRAVGESAPDTPYAVLAGNLLFPRLPRGLPTFVPSFPASREISGLPPSRQLGALRARAARGEMRDLLLYGVGLQRVGRPLSAREAFARAARSAPGEVEASVAAAVGRFDKERPADAFGRLGPLTRRFPGEPTVRFHLGLLLLWTGRIDEAERQFRLASRTRAGSPLAREAERYLDTIRRARGTGG